MGSGFKDKSFVRKITICSSLAYLIATLPQLIIDPLLKHHIRFPSRQYHPLVFILIILIFLALLPSTYFLMRKSTGIFVNLIPFAIAVTISVPILAPEMPHGNLVTVSCLWSIFLILTFWIHNYRGVPVVMKKLKSSEACDKTGKIEYLKEEVQFWRMVLVGVAGGYFAIVISWMTFLSDLNKFIVGGYPDEVFILNSMTFSLIGLTSIGVVICPLAETIKKHRETTDLFLTIK